MQWGTASGERIVTAIETANAASTGSSLLSRSRKARMNWGPSSRSASTARSLAGP